MLRQMWGLGFEQEVTEVRFFSVVSSLPQILPIKRFHMI